MLRKLTSLLFKEEEVVVEEEHELEEIRIPEMKPLKPREEAHPSSKPVQDVSSPVHVAVEPVVSDSGDEGGTRKSFRIDLDERNYDKANETQAIQPLKEDVVRVESMRPYVTHDIISPIHGGPTPSEPLKASQVQTVKRRTPLTEVISPMYGKIEVESREKETVDLSILELDVESMITPEYESVESNDEVQTSLFDYLEGDQSRES